MLQLTKLVINIFINIDKLPRFVIVFDDINKFRETLK